MESSPPSVKSLTSGSGPADALGVGTDTVVNVNDNIASYWSSSGHMETDNLHQLSFMDTALPHLPPTFSPDYIFPGAHPQQPLASGSRNPLVTLEHWVGEWCERNGECRLFILT